ncbi:MAG: heme ABC transporter ATP-binding protein [Rhizobiales bacterium]|nr:heme ABC transporter ATP-binding protein [Hyphomicrobiales bacterium]
MIEGRDISVEIGRRRLLDQINIDIEPGRIMIIAGPNGAGKSTLMSVLAGERVPATGGVMMDGVPLSAISHRQLAMRRAVLLQQSALDFAFTVAEVVALGRLPHVDAPDVADDPAAIAQAAARADIQHLMARHYPTLSGGEKQRVQFARALAQLWHRDGGTRRYLFLDEPTSALDLRHQRLLLNVAAALKGESVGVLAILHDINLAAAYGDDLMLLRDGRCVAAGPVDEVLNPVEIEACFDLGVEMMTSAQGQRVFVPRLMS